MIPYLVKRGKSSEQRAWESNKPCYSEKYIRASRIFFATRFRLSSFFSSGFFFCYYALLLCHENRQDTGKPSFTGTVIRRKSSLSMIRLRLPGPPQQQRQVANVAITISSMVPLLRLRGRRNGVLWRTRPVRRSCPLLGKRGPQQRLYLVHLLLLLFTRWEGIRLRVIPLF